MSNTVSLIRTNVALTSNVKIIVDSVYNLYLESYNSNNELADRKYKKFLINENDFLSERYSKFYRNLPIDLAFEVKNTIKPDSVQTNFDNQIDDIYINGPRQISDNTYKEEFQYNTTLQIEPENLPKQFLIFRLDSVDFENDYENQDIFKHFKLIKAFDLSEKNKIGQLWKKNYIDDDELLRSPVELNFKPFEFSHWNGYNYYSGGTVSKSFMFDEIMRNETTYYDLEKIITDGFKNNGVICAHYTNISYLFDDTVSGIFLPQVQYQFSEYSFIEKLIKLKQIDITQLSHIAQNENDYYQFNQHVPYKKQWSINRYYGFYIDDLEKIDTISPFVESKFKNENIEIINNTFKLNNENIDPILEGYTDKVPHYIKIKNKYYLIQKNINEYVIISDININDTLQNILNTNQLSIKLQFNDSTGKTYIKNIDDTYYWNEYFDMYNKNTYLIKLLDQYYTLFLDFVNNRVYINSDEYIFTNQNYLYRKLGNHSAKIDNINISNIDNEIPYFDIYTIQFTEIKDFDFDRVVTKYAEIENDNIVDLPLTRPGLYARDIKSKDIPKPHLLSWKHIIKYNGTVIANNHFALPYMSEYAVSGDLYRVSRIGRLIDLWSLNQSINKWGIKDSLSVNAYPYKINNSLSFSDVHNLAINLYDPIPNLLSQNLDYFNSIGIPINSENLINSIESLYEDYWSNQVYLNNIRFRSVNIDMPTILENNTIFNQKFSIEYYKDIKSFDYFDYIFNSPVKYTYTNNIELTKQEKFAKFQKSDTVNGSEVFFRNINFYINKCVLSNPNEFSSQKRLIPLDLHNYSFSVVFTTKTTESDWGKPGIDLYLNHIHKNMLIMIYITAPHYSYSSICYRNRDLIYNEQFIKYVIYDNGQTKWIDSELQVQQLTLRNILSVLNISDENIDSNFKVNYHIIDDKKRYILSQLPEIINTTQIKLKFIDNINLDFAVNDWIYIKGLGILEQNYQIINKIDNNTIIIETNTTDINLPISTMNIIIENEKSVLPFVLKLKSPDKIYINQKVNSIEPVLPQTKIIPLNNSNYINELNLTQTDKGIIPHVYEEDYISRTLVKNTSKELNISQIEQLPYIYRYSGDYSPILNSIELFNNLELKQIDNKVITNIVLNFDTISIIVNENTQVDVNDIVYINGNLIALDPLYTKYLFSFYTVINIEIINNAKHIELSRQFDNSDIITANIDTNLLGISATIFKREKKRTYFKTDWKDFASINQIVSKNIIGNNIMQSNQPIHNTINRYPLIDEHGTTTVKKNILKSPWDKKFLFYVDKNNY